MVPTGPGLGGVQGVVAGGRLEVAAPTRFSLGPTPWNTPLSTPSLPGWLLTSRRRCFRISAVPPLLFLLPRSCLPAGGPHKGLWAAGRRVGRVKSLALSSPHLHICPPLLPAWVAKAREVVSRRHEGTLHHVHLRLCASVREGVPSVPTA